MVLGLCFAAMGKGAAQTVTNASGSGLAGTVETYSAEVPLDTPVTLYTVPSGKWFAITQVAPSNGGFCTFELQNGVVIQNSGSGLYVPGFIVPAGTSIIVENEQAGTTACWVIGILGSK
jgi:hypothetical protein